MSSNGQLKRELGLISATSIVIGIVIGSGVFVKPGKVLAATGGSTGWALTAWILGGILSLAGGLVISEIASRIPRTGGIYAYMEALYGKLFGFLCGWVQTLIYGPALMSALSLYFASLACQALGWDRSNERTLAITALFTLSFVNALGARYGGMVQTVSTFAKLLPIAIVAAAGTAMGTEPILTSSTAAGGASPALGMGAAILATLWAYDGWVMVGNMAGEMKNPKRDLPRALIIGLSVVIVAYLSVNVALIHTLPSSEVMSLNEKAAGAAATTLFGTWGGLLISLGILVSIFGCLNGNILTAPRVPYAMAERGEFPFAKTFARTHLKFGTPIHAMVLQVAIALLMIAGANSDWLTDIAVFSMYVFFTLAFFGLFKIRAQENPGNVAELTNTFRVPLYPVIPALAICGSLYILGSTALNQPGIALYAFGVMASGVPVYFWLSRKPSQLADPTLKKAS